MSEIALALHLSERTLRRQLADEETSFSEVHDRVRTERALELLQDPELAVAAIGNQLVMVPGIMWGLNFNLVTIWGVLAGICLVSALFIFSIIKKLNKVS